MSEKEIRARMSVELIGTPAELLPKMLEKMMVKFKEREGVKVLREEFLEPKPVGEKIYSSFVDVECNVNNIETLLGLVIDFAPSSIEIVEPEEVIMNTNEFQAIVNDLVAELRRVDTQMKQISMQNFALNQRIKALTDKANSSP